MKKIRVEDAVGTVIAHDLTRITRGEFKGVAFQKGHVVQEEDIPELLKIGKQYLYVLDLAENELHENEAARRIAKAISHKDLVFTEPKEGKITIRTNTAGLLKVNVDALYQINKMKSIIVATLKNDFPCKNGENVAATRIIPLTIPERYIQELEELTRESGPVLAVKPFRELQVGAVVTGSEVYKGLITDDFSPSVGKKIRDARCTLLKKKVVPDDVSAISQAVLELYELGCELIITTGGISVDPDDVTGQGVIKAGARVLFYGSPVLPGAMLMVSMLGNIPVISLPACVFYFQRTVFDLIFPKLLAGETLREEDIIGMGHGGLCMNCEVCHFPACPFGR